jgi:hypothetical protein
MEVVVGAAMVTVVTVALPSCIRTASKRALLAPHRAVPNSTTAVFPASLFPTMITRITPAGLRFRITTAGRQLTFAAAREAEEDWGGELAMLTVMQIARRIPWAIMGLILAGGLLHFLEPAELERDELIVIGALIVGLICFQVLRRRGV